LQAEFKSVCVAYKEELGRGVGMSGVRRSQGYQTFLVLMLSLNFGILFFDRNALNFLMPFVQPDLKLTDTQVGWLSSGLSFTWAVMGFTVGWLSDKLGSRKPIIVLGTIAFCLCSVVSGYAASFLILLGARVLMGAAEGGVMPVSHSMIATEVDEKHRGLAMGVGQNLGSNLLGSTAAPLILVPIALAFGWQAGFFMAAIPGLISAAIIWFYVQEPAKRKPVAGEAPRATLAEAFADRNVQLCALISILLVSYLVLCWAFMPLFLTKERGFGPNTVKWLMATLGISAGIGSFAVTALSDRIGRKPSMIGFSLLGVILPLGAMFFTGSSWALAAIFFFGWALNGLFPLFMATIPSESVDPRLTASLTGVCMGIGEVIGGVLSPILGGKLSDLYGRDSIMWLMIALCLLAALVGFGLRETAPRVVGARGSARAAAA
jgi:MFS transporter, ACS family, hexuronate transporter